MDFSNQHYLANLNIGAFAENEITSLDFSGCKSLKNISAFAFFDNELTEVRIPATIELIGFKAFYNNPNLRFACYEGKQQPKGAREAFTQTILPESSFLKCPPKPTGSKAPIVEEEFILDPDGQLEL